MEGKSIPPDQQIALVTNPRDGVLGELGERCVDLLALVLELLGELFGVEHPAGEDLLTAAEDCPAVDRQRVAVLEQLEKA